MQDTLKSPSHIVLVGPMGAGKSRIGRLLATRLQWLFVDLDSCIEAEARATISSIFASEGEAGFRARESRALKDVLMHDEACVLATGGGAILDEANRRTMRGAGTVVYLQVEPAMQVHRLQGDDTRPLLASGDPSRRLAQLQAEREPLYRDVADLVFDTTPHSPESAAGALASLLARATEHGA